MKNARHTFALAGLIGAVATGGAIATGASSFATGTTTTTGSASTTSTTAASTSSVASPVSKAAGKAYLDVTARVQPLPGRHARISLRFDGRIYTNGVDRPDDAVAYQMWIGKDYVFAGRGEECRGNTTLQQVHKTYTFDTADYMAVKRLSVGRHTLRVSALYCTGPDASSKALTQNITFETLPGASSPTTGTGTDGGSNDQTAVVEPPTPSPTTTKLGVTG